MGDSPFALDFIARRDVIAAAHSDFRRPFAKRGDDMLQRAAARKKKLERELGAEAAALYGDALAIFCGPDLRGECIAEAERMADEITAKARGWKTLDDMRADNLAALKALAERK